MKLNDLKPASYNPRKISDEQLERLKKSLAEFGDLSGIVFNRRTGNVVGGHQRLKCMPADAKINKKELTEISRTGTVATGSITIDNEQYTYREVDWSIEKEKQANIAANKHSGEWDDEKLSEILKELSESPDFNTDLLGFDSKEIDAILSQITKEGQIDDDEIPEVDAPEPITKTGDLYFLGKHRLLCGDSTKIEDVKALMDGKKADSMVTDPPYGVNLNANYNSLKKFGRKKWGTLQNDADSDAFPEFCRQFFQTSRAALKERAAFFCWYGSLNHAIFEAAARAAGFLIYRQLIWVKPCFVLSILPFHWRHEPCFYGWVQGKKPDYSRIPMNETTVWEIDYDGKKGHGLTTNTHPTMKPVALMQRCVEYASPVGEIVLDPFLGSGSTLIACEKTNRICYGMEIDSHYCDVIVTRYCKYTGNNKIIKNGEEITWQL